MAQLESLCNQYSNTFSINEEELQTKNCQNYGFQGILAINESVVENK